MLASLSEVYTYDSLNQIASYKLGTLNSGKTDVTGSPSYSQSWDYDAVGNWDSITTNSTTQTRSANKQNEITSVSGATTPVYDSNGNLTTDENNYRFVYDAWNRLVQVKNSSNVVIITYGRDALHRHVTDTVGSTVTDRFFSGDWQVLETKTGSNTVTRNVWSPVYVDGLVLRDRDTDGNGSLDERLYALQDANWNTTGLVSAGGTVQERYTYTPFGQVTFRDGSGSTLSGSAKDWVFLHQGGERIAAGDYEFRNRVYSPSLGRWLSNDPLGFRAGDVNFYRYIQNRPIQFTDPNGTIPPLAAAGIVVLAAGSCVWAHFVPGLKFYPHDEEMRHCWTSCMAARTCSMAISAAAGLGFEVVTETARALFGEGDLANSFYDIINNGYGLKCAGIESIIPILGNLGRLFRESCECCCKRELNK